jgi:hypothetical protein
VRCAGGMGPFDDVRWPRLRVAWPGRGRCRSLRALPRKRPRLSYPPSQSKPIWASSCAAMTGPTGPTRRTCPALLHVTAPLADFRGHCQVAQVAGWPFGRHRESDGGDAEDCDAAFEIFADSCLPGAISTAWVVPVVWTDLIAVIETHDFVNIWH